jgi:type II secretory pathway component PulL
MPEFRFALVHGNQQHPLGRPVELPDGDAACTQAEVAIKQVFGEMKDAYEWSDWHLSVRDQDNEEFAVISITDTLLGERRIVGS